MSDRYRNIDLCPALRTTCAAMIDHLNASHQEDGLAQLVSAAMYLLLSAHLSLDDDPATQERLINELPTMLRQNLEMRRQTQEAPTATLQ